MTDQELLRIVAQLRTAATDTRAVEAREAVGKLPTSVVETLSAFSNGSGGIIILGLSEKDGFRPAASFDAKRMADALAQACSDKLTPPVRAAIDIATLDGANIVVATVPEMPPHDKPCYVSARGMYKGSYVRAFDGDRHLSNYEIDHLLEDRTQPSHDLELVRDAVPADLEPDLLQGFIRRQRDLHPRVFANASDQDILLNTRVLGHDESGALHPTLAGLLALGTYPQRCFPRLTVTFAAYPGTEKASNPSLKFTDSEKLVGPIPYIIQDSVTAVKRNTRTAGVMEGALRIDRPDYPEAAVREAVCNALMHRDYSQLARGTQVQVNLYADRLEVLSPGGLYGTATIETLGHAGYSSTRNQYLSDILESVPSDQGFVAENRGTGFALMQTELKRNGMRPPEAWDSLSMFQLTFWRADVGHAGAKPLGTPPDDEVLAYVSAHQNCTAAEISEQLGLSRSAVTYRLHKLIEAGEVVRTAPPRSKRQRYRLRS